MSSPLKNARNLIDEESDSESVLSVDRFDSSDSESQRSEEISPKKMFKSSERKKIQVTFENVIIKTIPKQNRCCKKSSVVPQQSKVILNDVSGTIEPGQFLAILGASGAGKTTLLNYLSGREISRNLDKKGQVYINGVEKERVKGFSALSAYVQQDDILFQTMTVRECLEFAAKLKLQGSYEEKMYRVEEIIKELRLNKCQNTKIGGPLVKGVSGGERKRTSIGVELITDPQLIFLDEPTTGLDSFTALSVVDTLRDLAMSGRTVISTIHQPNSQIFDLFDRLMLIAQGRIIYLNEAKLACDYFASINYRCPDLSNPADYFMTIMSLESQEEEANENKSKRRNTREEIFQAYTKRIDFFQESYDKSEFKNDYAYISPKVRELNSMDVNSMSAPWLYQLLLLIKRNLLNTLRLPQTSYAKLITTTVTAGFTIVLFQDLTGDLQGIQNRNGCLFFITLAMSFNAIQSVILVFPDERPVFMREVNNNMYSVSAYFLGKIFAEIPSVIILPTLFGSIIYFAVGFSTANAYTFPLFLIIMMQIFSAGSSYALIISSIFGDKQLAVTLIPVLIIPFMLFAGFFVSQDNIPSWLIIIQYLSFFKYSYQSLMLNEYQDLKLECMKIPEDEYGHCDPLGDFNSPQNLAQSMLCLAGLYMGGYLVSFIILKSLSKTYN